MLNGFSPYTSRETICGRCQREAEKPVHNRTMWGNMADRSLRMWRFTLRLPHYVVRFIGFKLQQVSGGREALLCVWVVDRAG